MSMFIAASDGLLIHKTTKCLWRISDDKKSIEPVFGSDVLSDEEVDGIVATLVDLTDLLKDRLGENFGCIRAAERNTPE